MQFHLQLSAASSSSCCSWSSSLQLWVWHWPPHLLGLQMSSTTLFCLRRHCAPPRCFVVATSHMAAVSSVAAIVYKLGRSTSFGGAEKKGRSGSTLCLYHGWQSPITAESMGLREEDAKASDKRQQTASSHKCRRSTFFDEGAARIGSRTPHPCRFAASIDTAELAPHAHAHYPNPMFTGANVPTHVLNLTNIPDAYKTNQSSEVRESCMQ